MPTRALRTLLLSSAIGVIACSGKVVETTSPDGGSDSTIDVAPPDIAPPDGAPGGCCPVGAPSCLCPLTGGSPPCNTGPCDIRASDWETRVDGRGCTFITPKVGARSCGGPPPPDAGPDFGKDAGSDFGTDFGTDSGTADVDTGVTFDKTVGKACTTDAECDITGYGDNACSNGLFAKGTLYPTPICIGKGCDPGDGTSVALCDGGTGLCLSTGAGGICLPHCTFDGSGSAPSGCIGKNVCYDSHAAVDATGKLVGDGYCFGGCRVDSDCTKGDKCQVEQALCFKTLDIYTFALGDSCTKSDVIAKPPKCNCAYGTTSGKGYCTTFCRFGIDACATGYTCDPLITPLVAGAKAPTGIAGECLKNCTSDTDCTASSTKCKESTGTGQKTCQPGP